MQVTVFCRDDNGESEYSHASIENMCIRGGYLYMMGPEDSHVHIVYAEGAWHHYVTQAEPGEGLGSKH